MKPHEKYKLIEDNKDTGPGKELRQKKQGIKAEQQSNVERDENGRFKKGSNGNKKGAIAKKKKYKTDRTLMAEMLEHDDLMHAFYLERIKESINEDIDNLTPKQRLDFMFKCLDYILPKVSRKEVVNEVKKTFKVELPELVKRNPEVIEAEFEDVDWQEEEHPVDAKNEGNE